MKACCAVLVAASLAAAAAHASSGSAVEQAVPERAAQSSFHGGLSLGLGTSYDGAGARLEFGSDHLSAFVGIGLLAFGLRDTKSSGGDGGLSWGARLYQGVQRGLFLSLNFTWARWYDFSNYDLNSSGSPTNPGTLFTSTAVLGYRIRGENFYVELGIGGGMYREKDPYTCSEFSGPSCGPQAASTGLIPDAAIGVGFDL